MRHDWGLFWCDRVLGGLNIVVCVKGKVRYKGGISGSVMHLALIKWRNTLRLTRCRLFGGEAKTIEQMNEAIQEGVSMQWGQNDNH